MELFKETWQEVPPPKTRAHNNCYRNPAIWSRHIAKQRFWFSTSAVTAMQNFSMQVLLVDPNVRAIHRNALKYRHKLISFQSLNRAFEIQNQSSLERFLYS